MAKKHCLVPLLASQRIRSNLPPRSRRPHGTYARPSRGSSIISATPGRRAARNACPACYRPPPPLPPDFPRNTPFRVSSRVSCRSSRSRVRARLCRVNTLPFSALSTGEKAEKSRGRIEPSGKSRIRNARRAMEIKDPASPSLSLFLSSSRYRFCIFTLYTGR